MVSVKKKSSSFTEKLCKLECTYFIFTFSPWLKFNYI